MRLGIFGGSFDPPHVGHYLAAVDAAEQLELDKLLWVPVAQQPLREEHRATVEQRFEMVSAAVESYPKFEASRTEIDRKGLSYTVTTVEALAQEYPNAERFLFLGSDAWDQFGNWHQPERIREFVQIAVLTRTIPGQNPDLTQQDTGFGVPDHMLRTRIIDVSSTEVRDRVKAGKSINGFVADAVVSIIESEGLYRW